MNLLKIKNIDLYFVIAILIALLLVLLFSDTSNIQSAHEIDIALNNTFAKKGAKKVGLFE